MFSWFHHNDPADEKRKIALKLRKAVLNARLQVVHAIVAKHGHDAEIMNFDPFSVGKFTSSDDSGTALIVAARKPHPDIVSALLQAESIDLNAVDKKQQEHLKTNHHSTPLIAAVIYKQMVNIALLTAKEGVNPNAVTPWGMSALMFATRYCPDAIPLLAKMQGIDVNARDNKGRTALHHACLYESRLAAFNALLKLPGINVNAVDAAGHTPLMYAAERADFEMTGALLFANADMEIKDPAGNTAEMIAINAGHYSIASSIRDFPSFRQQISSSPPKYINLVPHTESSSAERTLTFK